MPLVLVVGPSGAGKDTLIRHARAALAGQARYVFPRRLVTRAPSPDEDNAEIAESDFTAGEAAGRFALSWRAHGLGYALPPEAADRAGDGHVVVCNVSRSVVADARTRFARVAVVEVTAPAEVLAERLSARGRAADGDLAARLARREAVTPDLTIENVGPPEGAGERLVAFLAAL